MQNQAKYNLTFLQAINFAADTIPGLRHDLNQLKDLRNSAKARDLEGTGRIALKIPDPCEPILQAYHPELFQADKELEARAWLKFMKHPDSEPFRYQKRL